MPKALVLLCVLCAIALPGIAGQAGQPKPSPSPAAGKHHHACGEGPVPYPGLHPSNFTTFDELRPSAFGHRFNKTVPQRKLAALLSIYGYDYIGTYSGYLLFYRRAESWYSPGSLPRLTAPNGELLPPIGLPSDLDPEWPSPGLLASQAPFIGAIVLPQQIIALPCERS